MTMSSSIVSHSFIAVKKCFLSDLVHEGCVYCRAAGHNLCLSKSVGSYFETISSIQLEEVQSANAVQSSVPKIVCCKLSTHMRRLQ